MIKKSNIQGSVVKQFLETRKENEESFFVHPPYQLETELLYWIGQTNEYEAIKVLEKINKLERAWLSNSPLRSLKNSFICSCTLFTRATITAGVASEYAFDLSDIFIRKIENVDDMWVLQELEYEMVHTFIQAIRDYQRTPYQNEIVDRAVYYIHDNILQPLTLEGIAEETSVSPNYLSSLFHKVVGIPLRQYINRKKIAESTYFLEHTDSTLLDIALLFGFCNQSYYTSLFKKFNGVTPGQYKKKISL